MGFVRGIVVFPCLFCFCLLSADAVYTGSPKVAVVPGPANFIEDKVTNFSCFLENSTSDVQIRWFIRDQKSGLKTFFTNRELNLLPALTSKPNDRLFFAMPMRRDFMDSELVCKVIGGKEGVLPLPEIKETVPIEKVLLTPTDFVVGQKFEVNCEVKSKRSPKVVKIRNLLEYYPPNYHSSPSASWIRYTFDRFDSNETKFVTFHKFNNLKWQCQAMTVGEKSKTGNVMSKVAALTVHFFQFTSPTSDEKRVIERNKPLELQIKANANPAPLPSQMTVLRCVADICKPFDGPTKVEIVARPGPVAKGSKMSERGFTFTVQFTPANSGVYYKVQFRSRFVNQTSKTFFVEVIYLQFFPVTSAYKDNSSLRLNFTVAASPSPLKSEFRVTSNRGPVPVISSSVKKRPDANFDVELVLRSNRSARLQVVFRSNLLQRASEQFAVKAWTPPAKASIGMLIGVLVGVLLVIGVLVIVTVCALKRLRQKQKDAERQKDGDREETVPLRDRDGSPQQPGGGSSIAVEVKSELEPPRTKTEVVEPNGDSSPPKPPTSKDAASQKPPAAQASQKPAAAQASEKPAAAQASEKPAAAQASQKPAAAQASEKPPAAQASQKPAAAQASQKPPAAGDRLPSRFLFKVQSPEKAATKKIAIESEGKNWSAVLSEGLQGVSDSVVFQLMCATDKFIYSPYVLRKPGCKLAQDYFNEHAEALRTPYVWKKMHFVSKDVKARFFVKQHFELILNVQADVDCVQLSADRVPSVLPSGALSQPEWAVFVPGMRCGQRVFPQLRCERTSNFWRPSKRWVVENEENLVASEKVEHPDAPQEEWRRAFILLKDGDPLPNWDLLQDKILDTYRREKAKVAVVDGRLKVEQTSTSTTWQQPCSPDDFDKMMSHPTLR